MTLQGDHGPPVEPSSRRRIRNKTIAVMVPTGVALGAGAVFAYGAIPASDGTIGACYVPNQSVRFVDGPDDCATNTDGPTEQFLKFNQQGQQGPPGPAGSVGAPVYPIPASDYLLEIDGIKGESTDQKHKDSIDIESYSWGASNTGTHSAGGGGGAGKVVFQDLHVVKSTDAASPLLLKAAATGQHIKKAVLFARKAGKGQQEYLKITLSDVIVTSLKTDPQAPGADVGETEDVALNFAKIEYSYAPQKPDGSLEAPIVTTYDLKANKAG